MHTSKQETDDSQNPYTPDGGDRMLEKLARATLVVLYSIVMGTLLFWAIVEFLAQAEGARIFRYQGF